MRFGSRGTAALEFALAAPTLLVLMFGAFEFARLQWTWEALQLAGDQTARCVAIAGTACGTPNTYAVTTAHTFGAVALVAAGVTIDNTPPTVTNASACSPPSGNTEVRVRMSLSFTSPFSTLIPSLTHTLVTTSCYPTTGN